jgi:hypothetical protein
LTEAAERNGTVDPFDIEALRDTSEEWNSRKQRRPGTAHVQEAHRTHPRVELRRCATERAFADEVLNQLVPWFKIDQQVYGVHPSGQRPRIDAILRPLDPSGWLDPDPALGVEFKQPSSGGDQMRLIAQALDYTYVNWNNYGRVDVFICTPGTGLFGGTGGWADPSFVLGHLLGQLGIGELCYLGKRHRGWALLIHGHHRLWTEHDGVEEARRRTIRPKVGSR